MKAARVRAGLIEAVGSARREAVTASGLADSHPVVDHREMEAPVAVEIEAYSRAAVAAAVLRGVHERFPGDLHDEVRLRHRHSPGNVVRLSRELEADGE